MAASRHDGDSQASAAICFQSFLRSLLREISRSVTSNTHLFLLPGTRANAARHFLCRAPAQSVEGEIADHAAPIFGNASRKASRSEARIRVFLPSLRAGSLPSRIKR